MQTEHAGRDSLSRIATGLARTNAVATEDAEIVHWGGEPLPYPSAHDLHDVAGQAGGQDRVCRR
jgi:hypothetical protein